MEDVPVPGAAARAAVAAWGAYDVDDPFDVFAELRAQAPVQRVRLADGHVAWIVLGYDEARDVLGDPRWSKDMQAAMASSGEVVAEGLPGPALARHMLNVDPPDHTRMRRLVSGTFTARRIAALRPRISELVDGLLDDVAAAGPDAVVDLVAALAFPLPFTVICELLGLPEHERPGLSRAFTDLFLPGDDGGPPPEAVAGAAYIIAFLDRWVAAKRAEPGEDLVSALIQARADVDGVAQASLTHQELCSTLFVLFVAGHDTTASLIGNGTVALLTHPQQLAALQADLSLVPRAVEEFLRFDPPGHHATFRYSPEPVQVGGVTIPAGEQVLVCLAAVNRDPAHFAEPDALDLTRADQTRHIAFGHGIHFCLGAALARMEAEIAFTALLSRFPALRLAVPKSGLRWSHGDGIVLRGLASLPVVPGPDAVPR